MKKMYCLILAILLTLCMCSCSTADHKGSEVPSVNTESTSDTQPAETQPQQVTPTEAKPAETQPQQPTPTEAKSVETQPQQPTLEEATEAPEESTEAHKHEYTFRVTTIPTCTTSGVRTHICKTCGATYLENIPPLAHAYTITELDPTCTNSGYTLYVCKTCGYSYSDDIRPALGHTYGAWTVAEEATTDSTGLIQRTCYRCSERETAVLETLKPAD